MNTAPPSTSALAAPATSRGKRRIVLWSAFVLLAVPVIPFIIGSVAFTFGNFDEAYTQGKVRSLEAALISFKIQHGFTPAQSQGLEALVTKPDDPRVNVWQPLVKSTALMDPWGNKVQYRYPGTRNPENFDVFSLGPDGVESADDIGNW